jgi:hypothetical protein
VSTLVQTVSSDGEFSGVKAGNSRRVGAAKPS